MGVNIVSKAIDVAIQAHQGQLRKDGKTPYIEHPFSVVKLLCLNYHSVGDEYIAAAIGHDLLEDTTYNFTMMENDFGYPITHIVSELTNKFKANACPNWSRKQRKEAEHIRLGQCSYIVQIIKCADRIDNLRDLCNGNFDNRFINMYLHESQQLHDYLVKARGSVLHNMLGKEIDNQKLNFTHKLQEETK